MMTGNTTPINTTDSYNESDQKSNFHQTGKVVCVGRNYAAHAEELGNDIPSRPLLFIKPASSVISTNKLIPSQIIDRPRGITYNVHYEAELCIRLGKNLKNASVDVVKSTHGLIDAVTLGLDLTLRDLQSELKQKGHPWERAKCFDGSAVICEWLDAKEFADLSNISYQLLINNQITQHGDTSLMLFSIPQLLSDISYAFSLQAGDFIMTGTPSGVGVLNSGDKLALKLGNHEWLAYVASGNQNN